MENPLGSGPQEAMNSGIGDQKHACRVRIRQAVKRMAPADRCRASERLCHRLLESAPWRRARAALLFYPLPDEPDIRPVLRQALTEKQRVALPWFDAQHGYYRAREITDLERDLGPGAFKIVEPSAGAPLVDLKQLDFVLVPGVAFTPEGSRLGRGRGFYDRLLSSFRGLRCGIGFDEQIVPTLPIEEHDICLDLILTPSRWWSAAHRRL